MEGMLVRGALNIVFKVLKLCLRLFFFIGLYWFVLAITPSLIYEIVMQKGSADVKLLVILTDVLGVIALVLCILTFMQNIIRLVKKDQSYSLYKTLNSIRKKRMGFETSFNDIGNTIVLKTKKALNGVIFGKYKGKYVVKPEETDGHILVIGGAGSGKTTGVAIPTLMSWEKAVFAIDIKGELYEKTRKARGISKIKVFNPLDKTAYGYDPYYMLRNTDDLSGEARALALAICPLPPDIKDPFWIKSAQNMFTGLIIHFFSFDLSFSETTKLIKSKPIRELIDEVMASTNQRAIAEISQFSGMDDKTLSGIFTELSNNITIFATNDYLQNALNGQGQVITPQDLEDGYDIYCCIPEEKLEQWKDLLRMMVNQFLKSFEKRPVEKDEPILFLIDEFPRLGKIDAISNGLATLRGKKIHIALIVQSKSQLNAIYGKDVAEVIADNCTYKAILKASEPNTQEWCSKLIGTYDKAKLSANYNADILGMGKGKGTNRTTEEKRIIKPEEFAYLKDIVCVFPNGYKRIEKTAYYKDSAFCER